MAADGYDALGRPAKHPHHGDGLRLEAQVHVDHDPRRGPPELVRKIVEPPPVSEDVAHTGRQFGVGLSPVEHGQSVPRRRQLPHGLRPYEAAGAAYDEYVQAPPTPLAEHPTGEVCGLTPELTRADEQHSTRAERATMMKGI